MARRRVFSGPLVPGTTSVRQIRKVKGKKRPPLSKIQNLTRLIRSIQLKALETKRSSQYTESAQQLFHNKAYYAERLLSTTQGTADPHGTDQAALNRVGDEVLAKGISLKFFLENQADNPNVIYKLYVFRYNTLQLTIDDTYFWCGTDGAGANMNRTLDKPHTDRMKILKIMNLNPTMGSNNSGTTAKVKTKNFSCWIPLNNRKIQYNADNSPLSRFTDIGFAVLAYDAINTLETTVIANLQWQSTFYFKDP